MQRVDMTKTTDQSKRIEQIKQRFRDQGQTVSSWARAHGFRPNAVHRVLNEYDIGHYGTAHKIAQALGLKPAVASSLKEFTAKREKAAGEQKRRAA